jgi:hypothetical protein
MLKRKDDHYRIAHMMMQGCNGPRNIPNELVEEFRERHFPLISYLKTKGMPAGILAAFGKAILFYGDDQIKPFFERFRKKDFQGIEDPVHVFWEWLINKSGTRLDTVDAYRRTITIIRYQLREGKLSVNMKKITPSLSDFFEWEDNYTKMVVKRNINSVKSRNKKNK